MSVGLLMYALRARRIKADGERAGELASCGRRGAPYRFVSRPTEPRSGGNERNAPAMPTSWPQRRRRHGSYAGCAERPPTSDLFLPCSRGTSYLTPSAARQLSKQKSQIRESGRRPQQKRAGTVSRETVQLHVRTLIALSTPAFVSGTFSQPEVVVTPAGENGEPGPSGLSHVIIHRLSSSVGEVLIIALARWKQTVYLVTRLNL